MTPSLFLACLWLVLANVLGMLPSRDNHWTRAYVLIALGVPLIGWVWWQSGPWVGMVVLLAGMSVLRWPMLYLIRWVRARLG
ncbi:MULTISPECIES: DUF2484 family protein [unclassified Salipiger]|uniref:DUF2484 family protein n=1 Tax=unclassified Salipiger TaxID=2640570 RepID=UPI0013B6B5ED|nr:MULTISPECIES: DUF2484 family protein [unclassified Salipiger]NDV49650.1 DUF2484 family protein [Salipiger sp. PrR003]NDW34516.1 DUF2484 family protein [Salipiger sp. PrR007]